MEYPGPAMCVYTPELAVTTLEREHGLREQGPVETAHIVSTLAKIYQGLQT